MAHWICPVLVLSTILIACSSARGNEKNVCDIGEICIDKDECWEYKRLLTLKGKERLREAKRLRGKICNRKPDRLCCKKEETNTTTTTTTITTVTDTCRKTGQGYPRSFLPAAEECGVSCLGTSSVVHGVDASLGEFPWAALLRYEKKREEWDNRQKKWVMRNEKFYHCGGTLINTWYVLTAAHCHTNDTKIVEVVLGELNVLTNPDCPQDEEGCDNPRVQKQNVKEVIIHSGYDRSNKASPNDIALVRMRGEVQLNRFVQLSCLPLPEYNLSEYFYNPEQHSATVIGWGATRNEQRFSQQTFIDGIFSNNLQKGQLPIQPLSKCTRGSKELQSSQLCAGGGDTHTDSCLGDSGGGLFVDSGDYPGQSVGNVHVQVGLVSHGPTLCGDTPAVYTRVDQFLSWIKEKIRS